MTLKLSPTAEIPYNSPGHTLICVVPGTISARVLKKSDRLPLLQKLTIQSKVRISQPLYGSLCHSKNLVSLV